MSHPRAVWLLLAATTWAGLAVAPSAEAQTEVAIVPLEWPTPVYPQIAESARIQGDVEVDVDVRADGSVEAARAVSGPPLLRVSAEDAARRARFDCRGCVQATTRYSLYVTYRQFDRERPQPGVTPLVVSPTQGWVTVVTSEPEIHINWAWLSVRGPTCLYLWRCASEWGGMEYYHDRIRAAPCLWLWNCGWRKREEQPSSVRPPA